MLLQLSLVASLSPPATSSGKSKPETGRGSSASFSSWRNDADGRGERGKRGLRPGAETGTGGWLMFMVFNVQRGSQRRRHLDSSSAHNVLLSFFRDNAGLCLHHTNTIPVRCSRLAPVTFAFGSAAQEKNGHPFLLPGCTSPMLGCGLKEVVGYRRPSTRGKAARRNQNITHGRRTRCFFLPQTSNYLHSHAISAYQVAH